jgi:hypothetical protein
MGTTGEPYSVSFDATTPGAPAGTTYFWLRETGTLPDGLSLSVSGVLSGTPTRAMTATFSLRAHDADGCHGFKSFTLEVRCPTVTVAADTIPNFTVGIPITPITLNASTAGQATQTYTWTVTPPLPPGLTLTATTGQISGTPIVARPLTNYTFTATNAQLCSAQRPISFRVLCPTITHGTLTLAQASVGQAYLQSTAFSATGMTGGFTFAASGLPPGMSFDTATAKLIGTPTIVDTFNIVVTATSTTYPSCSQQRVYPLPIIGNMRLGNLVWVDTNNDGLHQSTESGVPALKVELWNAGPNGLIERGAGDDIKHGQTTTDLQGLYAFNEVGPGNGYYVLLPTPPLYHNRTTSRVIALDNDIDDDNNAIQPGGSGTAVHSPKFDLTVNGEPNSAIDGDGPNGNLTLDFGFAEPEPCFANTLIDNSSFEFDGSPNTTGNPFALLGYNGTGTSFGSNVNSLQWVGSVNGTSPLNAPIARQQVLAASPGAKVSWVESRLAWHGRRFMVFEGTDSCLDLRASGGGSWSSRLTAGQTYEFGLYSDTASSATSGFLLDLSAAGSIIEIVGGAQAGLHQYYTATQAQWQGPLTKFQATDYNGWNDTTTGTVRPNWRKFTFSFRIKSNATADRLPLVHPCRRHRHRAHRRGWHVSLRSAAPHRLRRSSRLRPRLAASQPRHPHGLQPHRW